MRHGSLFKSATAPTGGITLVALYSAWVTGTWDIRNFPLLPFWVTPMNCGANWEIWHGSLFIAATVATGSITLVALYSAWAAAMEDI